MTDDGADARHPAQGRLAQPWSVGEAVGVGALGLRSNLGALCGAHLVRPVGLALAAVAAWRLDGTMTLRTLVTHPPLRAIHAAEACAAFAIVLLVCVFGGLCMMHLSAARGTPARFGDLARGVRFAPRMLGYFVTQLVVLLLPTFGLANAGLSLAPFFIVDQDMGLFAALAASWRATRRNKASLWLYNLALLAIRAVSVVIPPAACVAQPVYGTGLAYAYTRLIGDSSRAPLAPDFGQRALYAVLRVTLGISASAFAGVTFLVMRLPPVRGSAWTPQDAVVRALAIVLGTTTTIALLATLLPWVLNRLENLRPTRGGRRFEFFVAARHVRSQKSGFLTVISVLSICGVALSSCALSTVISVMGGFSQDLKHKILGNNAHIVIDTAALTPFASYEPTLARVRALAGVAAATPVVNSEVMMASGSNHAGVIVKGVDVASIGEVIDMPRSLELGQFDYLANPERLRHLPPTEVVCFGPGGEQYTKGAPSSLLGDDLDPVVRAAIDYTPPPRPAIIIGRELGRTLHVCVGDEVTLVSPLGDLGPMGVMPRTRKFTVAGIFYSGMYEYDASLVYTELSIAQDYFAAVGKISAIDVKVVDGERADQMTPQVIAAIDRSELRVRDWREMNKNLFSALKLERVATFVILSLAILVASFCIICTLLLMVTEKGKEIAILKALGATDGAILRTFITEGVIIGGIGTVFGVSTGLALCSGLAYFGLRLNPDIYYIDKLPIQVSGLDFVMVALAAFTICTLATIYPAYAASRLRPVDGLRYG